MRASTGLVALALIAGVAAASAETHSDFNKQYDLTTLKTFDFKPQHRLSHDPIANNEIWGTEIRNAIAADFAAHGLVQDGTQAPDFLVAYYVGLKERYDVRYLGYGLPFYGRRFRGVWGGWPQDYDVWAVPYTESTLIIDIIDAHTNQLVWRGYNQDPINLGKPDKDFAEAVRDVLKKFYSDAKKSASEAGPEPGGRG